MVRVLWVGDYEKWVIHGVPGQCDMLFVGPRLIGHRGRRIDTYCHPPHENVDKSSAVAASFSAARVVPLVLPAPEPQLMVVRCVVHVRCVL